MEKNSNSQQSTSTYNNPESDSLRLNRVSELQSDWPPRFTIDQASILELFTGETFYSSVDASIREAILNSVDAVGRRQADSEIAIQPQIEVIFDRQSRTLTVSDNGDGMGKEQVSALFTRIGASAARITSNAGKNDYKSVGEFGIGVLSYFLVCQRFEIHSVKTGSDPLGLELTREMLDAKTSAGLIVPRRQEQGTNLILFIDTEEFFNKIQDRFPHWIRDVEGLVAWESPGEKVIEQGGISREIKEISVSKTPKWVQVAHIGPPILSDRWEHFDGSAHVDILYRGVFVASVSIPNLWAIEGVIHVDPKYFRPKLNREGFVGDQLQSELEPFLHTCHPAVLERALECVHEVLRDEVTQGWTLRRWVTLWLAVPRSGPYDRVAKLWDEEFRSRKAFRLLGPGEQTTEVSIRDLEKLGRDKEELYVAPLDLRKSSQIIQQAVRVLRNSGGVVIQGVNRETTFLQDTNLVGTSTGEILVSHFKGLLPTLIQIGSVAKDVIKSEAITLLFDNEPFVQVVRIGPEATAVLPVGDEIWVNIDNDAGREVVRTVCTRNEGHIGFWVACMRYGGEHAQQIANLLIKSPLEINKMGPIKRQYLLGIVN